ncbi:MAG TPA: hypothetical protein VF484_09780 [Candidatus Limnocylindrales bacterium]
MDAMPALVIFTITAALLAILAVASNRWGTDSRPGFGEDANGGLA